MSATPAPRTAARMTAAASRFLASLPSEQRATGCFAFGDEDQRREWSFLPVPDRAGLRIGDLDDARRKLAHELIVASLSLPGYTKAVSVMAMEHVLRALVAEHNPETANRLFDPGRYCLKFFGVPGEDPWGWQLAGHHVSLSFTVAGDFVAPTPCMLGSEPASHGTLAPLADDEELGFRLVNSLDAAQSQAAIISRRSPPNLATRMVPRIGEVERPAPAFVPDTGYVLTETERDALSYVRSSPKGLPAHALDKPQLLVFRELVGSFLGRLPQEVAAAQLRDVEQADGGVAGLTFAWAGGTTPGQPHYFRVQGPVLLIEHDNTEADGNHIHSVWRNPDGDFGDDILAAHYRQHH
jgi:hypothetical protein